MRIGILTLPLHTNYGGILQAYALQTVLERMGHEVVVLDTPKNKMLRFFGRYFHDFFCLRGLENFANKHPNLLQTIINRKIDLFVKKYIHIKSVNDFGSLKECDFDAVVVGSDQIWRPIYFPRWMEQPMENAYLSFTKGWNVKRISYAASFGTDEWEYDDEQTRLCREYMKYFDAISVREKSGVELCRNYLHADAQHVLDPTMLLKVEDYSRLFRLSKTKKSAGNLLCYVLDETKEIVTLRQELVKKCNFVPFNVNNQYENDESKSIYMRTKPSVEEWLRGFYDADFVITDSFHACVFSIIFKKQFLVVGNGKRGMSRFESLLAMFGLEDRLVCGDCDLAKIETIDFNKVYSKYEGLKNESMSFLRKYMK